MEPSRPSGLRFAGHALAGSATVLLAAYIGVRLHVNFATTGFLHLLIVVLVAMMAGFWEATVTSLAALICLNYFFVPPVFTFYVSDPQNWVALITFESTALLVSRLEGRPEIEAALVAGFERLLTRYRAAYPDGEPGARAPRIDRRRNKGRPRAPRSKSQSVKAP